MQPISPSDLLEYDMLNAGVKVPIMSSVYEYTKVLAHNLNSKKTSGAAIG